MLGRVRCETNVPLTAVPVIACCRRLDLHNARTAGYVQVQVRMETDEALANRRYIGFRLSTDERQRGHRGQQVDG